MSEPFVELDWLRAHLDDPQLRIVDARSKPHGAPGLIFPTGAEQYATGHIPHAIHLDYAVELADPATPYAARVAPPEFFAKAVGERSIGDRSSVVAYDDGTVPYAARIVWMFRLYGHDDVHILAGGLPAWLAAGLPLVFDIPDFPPETFTPKPRPELRASRDEVLAVAERRSDVQLLETQRDGTYALRDRDIAGAVRLSASQLLEDSNGGRLAPLAEIARMSDERGLDRNKRTIVTCGSGVGASGSYLALLAGGFTDLAVYDGSWMEWSHDALPTVEKPKNQK
jgi:thiosulfate/3-mercaptopyruvate sulfurtransferase